MSPFLMPVQMDEIVGDTLAFWEVHGCAVSIVRANEVLLCKGQIGSNNPIDFHTLFPLHHQALHLMRLNYSL
jgi:hypothetical protein